MMRKYQTACPRHSARAAEMGGLNGSQAEHLAQSIRQIVLVDNVLRSEKRYSQL